MGFALTQAQRWLAKRKDDIGKADQDFVARSAGAARRRRRRVQALVSVPVAAAALIAVVAWKQDWLKEESYALFNATPLTAAQESSIKSGDSFKECRDCPDMIVVPAGQFMMGSPDGRFPGADREHPKHRVTIARPFAVAKFELTFDEWDACAAHGDCDAHISDSGWGRGRQPAIAVSWDDAQTYIKWLSTITGRSYRLLSEAEYEYAARRNRDKISLGRRRQAEREGDGELQRLRQPMGR
jgi:formylglycine-generating enzyme required for sulfatase activity